MAEGIFNQRIQVSDWISPQYSGITEDYDICFEKDTYFSDHRPSNFYTERNLIINKHYCRPAIKNLCFENGTTVHGIKNASWSFLLPNVNRCRRNTQNPFIHMSERDREERKAIFVLSSSCVVAFLDCIRKIPSCLYQWGLGRARGMNFLVMRWDIEKMIIYALGEPNVKSGIRGKFFCLVIRTKAWLYPIYGWTLLRRYQYVYYECKATKVACSLISWFLYPWPDYLDSKKCGYFFHSAQAHM